MPSNSAAHQLAAAAHAGQKDKAGQPYIRRINRVAAASSMRAKHALEVDQLAIVHDDVLQVADLHDVPECSSATADELREAGFGDPVIDMVMLLTKPEVSMSHTERTDLLIASGNLGAILVRLSDSEDEAKSMRTLPAASVNARHETSMPRRPEAATTLGYTGT